MWQVFVQVNTRHFLHLSAYHGAFREAVALGTDLPNNSVPAGSYVYSRSDDLRRPTIISLCRASDVIFVSFSHCFASGVPLAYRNVAKTQGGAGLGHRL